MRTISVHVDEADYEQLKAAAARRGRPVAELLREAMAAWLANDRRSQASILDVPVHESGAMLGGWSRSDLLDEMLAR